MRCFSNIEEVFSKIKGILRKIGAGAGRRSSGWPFIHPKLLPTLDQK
jgi:hypothetical protein